MHLGLDMGRNQPALEQPLGLHRVLLGAVDMLLHLCSRHATPPAFAPTLEPRRRERIRVVADQTLQGVIPPL
jgi:hypothetical protein